MSTTKSPTQTVSSMSQQARYRQIGYSLAIVLIFSAMWPYNVWLSRIKEQKDLGEATIGQIDTGGFMLKLAMIGGFRGMVANSLWMQTKSFEKAHEWDKLKDTVDFITRLQPHFLSVWTYQGWNLAYNVSVEWDSPEDKYVWIKKGINFLKEGVNKNSKSPDLVWDTAWTYYHKLGFSDEAFILRRLFYDDPDDDGTAFRIDPLTGDSRNDNFLLSKSWFARAIDMVDEKGGQGRVQTDMNQEFNFVDRPTQHKGRPGDLHFRTGPPRSQSAYATALEKQSVKDKLPTFGAVASNEWSRAVKDWVKFGTYKWPAFRYEDQEDQMVQLDDITNEAAYAKLTGPRKHWTDRWAEQTNYRYWKMRSVAESTNEAVSARKLFYEGLRALREANFPVAAAKYREGLGIWEKLLEVKEFKPFRDDDLNKKETRNFVQRFLRALKQSGEKEPESYPFKNYFKGPQEDFTPDPFDQLEMSPGVPTSTTRPAAGGPARPR